MVWVLIYGPFSTLLLEKGWFTSLRPSVEGANVWAWLKMNRWFAPDLFGTHSTACHFVEILYEATLLQVDHH